MTASSNDLTGNKLSEALVTKKILDKDVLKGLAEFDLKQKGLDRHLVDSRRETLVTAFKNICSVCISVEDAKKITVTDMLAKFDPEFVSDTMANNLQVVKDCIEQYKENPNVCPDFSRDNKMDYARYKQVTRVLDDAIIYRKIASEAIKDINTALGGYEEHFNSISAKIVSMLFRPALDKQAKVKELRETLEVKGDTPEQAGIRFFDAFEARGVKDTLELRRNTSCHVGTGLTEGEKFLEAIGRVFGSRLALWQKRGDEAYIRQAAELRTATAPNPTAAPAPMGVAAGV